MKLSQICQWALAGLNAHYRANHFQLENALTSENYERADRLDEFQMETLAAEEQVIDLIVKIKKGEIIDETF